MAGLTPPALGMGTGLVPVANLAMLERQEAREAAAAANVAPVIQGLAAYVKRCFDAAYSAKQTTVDERLLACVRQRRGEYDPQTLDAIRRSGGSEIYMMLTSNKCRSASSWIKDVMFGQKAEMPWDIEPTQEPELSPEDKQQVIQQATQEAMMLEMQTGQMIQTPDQMRQFVTRIRDNMVSAMHEKAEEILKRMKSKMVDQLQEGSYYEAMAAFIDDLVTFPYAVIKGPVPRKKRRLQWVPGGPTGYQLDVKEVIQLCWDRVDPFMIYWAPHATDVDDGYIIERHQLTRSDLLELDGVEGYSSDAIQAVLDEHGRGGLKDWLSIDSQRIQAQGKSVSEVQGNPEATIDALQFWGSVQGKMLVEDFGMEPELVPDQLKEYECEVWQIGQWTIKAVINPDPVGRKPYYKTSYEKVPGSWSGNGVADLIRDAQNMCNAAARSLSNNMGISSGPQVYVNVDRLPAGEDVTQLYPWRIWQTTSDPFGSAAKPMEFFQPTSNALELMQIYEKFSVLADEYSGVPRYMTGDAPAQGAGRTASGMSMLMNNAGKSIKQVVGNVDLDVTEPLIERLWFYNMKYSDDPELKGDVRVVARGVNVLVAKEAAQVRMNEVLTAVLSSPILVDIVGEESIAELFREVTKQLNMDIVPPKEVIRARVLMRQQMMMLQAAMEANAQAQPDEVSFERDQHGAMTGMKVMPANKQRLQNGGPVTDNFAPHRR